MASCRLVQHLLISDSRIRSLFSSVSASSVRFGSFASLKSQPNIARRSFYSPCYFNSRYASSTQPRRFYSLSTSRDINTDKTDTNIIKEADIVRESASSRNQQRRREEEHRLEQLEQQLSSSLQRYQALLATVTDTSDHGDSLQQQQQLELREALIQLRNIYESLEYWDQALTLETVLLNEHAENMTLAERADTVYRQGKLHMRLGDLAQASRLYQEALNMFQHVCEQHGPSYAYMTGNVMISMAGVLFHRGRLEESLQVLVEAEPFFQLHDNDSSDMQRFHVDYVKCLQHQGLLHRSLQDFASARDSYQEALTVLEEVRDDLDTITWHEKRQGLQLDLADMLAALDQNDAACDLYQQILRQDREIRQSSEPTALEGIILHNLGRLHAQTESTRELALEELTRALELKQEFVGDTHPEVLKTLNALGALHAVMKNQSKALQCFQQSLLLARMHASSEDDEDVMLILRNIAVLKGEKVAKWGED